MSAHDQHYDGTATLAALENARNYNAAIESLLAQVPGIATARVLDVGAGTGEFSRRIAKMGASVSCVEPDATLRTALASEGFTCFARIEDAPDGFDAVTMVNVLEHIADDAAALVELRARLRPEGTLFVFVPALQVLYSRFDRAIGHHRRYTRSSLRTVVTTSGFRIDRLRWFDVLGVPTALLFRATRRSSPSAASVRIFDRFVFPLSQRLDRLQIVGKNTYCVAVPSGRVVPASA